MAVMALIISSFFRMRSFRSGKAALVLKLCLPSFRAEAPEEERACERLNSFYLTLAEVYGDTLSRLVSVREDRVSVSVNFRIVNDKQKSKHKRIFRKAKKPLVIERYIRSNVPLPFASERHLDVLDLDSGILLK